jgi:ectoine hydroxylase
MQLNENQLAQFRRDGYIFIPNVFDAAEVGVMRRELPGIFAQRRPENVREKTGDVVRTAFAVHTYNETFRRLVRHPNFIEPAERMLGGDTYIHQFKINAKAAFDGDVWQWHQDYGTWAADDDMPEPRAMNLAVFIDEVTEFNGPLMLIPGSHAKGKLAAGHDTTTTSYPLWTIDHATIARLANEGGIVAPKGPPGSVLFFHCNLVHGSGPNLSPWGRVIIYVSVNRADNAIRRFKRPEWIAHRDFTPLRALGADCLKDMAKSEPGRAA